MGQEVSCVHHVPHITQYARDMHASRKSYVMSEETMDFLKDTVAAAPDLALEVEAAPTPPKRRRKCVCAACRSWHIVALI